MTVRRIRGNDQYEDDRKLSSNMRGDCSYTGTLLGKLKVGRPMFLDVDGVIYCTGNVVSKKDRIFRTLKGFYEITY